MANYFPCQLVRRHPSGVTSGHHFEDHRFDYSDVILRRSGRFLQPGCGDDRTNHSDDFFDITFAAVGLGPLATDPSDGGAATGRFRPVARVALVNQHVEGGCLVREAVSRQQHDPRRRAAASERVAPRWVYRSRVFAPTLQPLWSSVRHGWNSCLHHCFCPWRSPASRSAKRISRPCWAALRRDPDCLRRQSRSTVHPSPPLALPLAFGVRAAARCSSSTSSVNRSTLPLRSSSPRHRGREVPGRCCCPPSLTAGRQGVDQVAREAPADYRPRTFLEPSPHLCRNQGPRRSVIAVLDCPPRKARFGSVRCVRSPL